MEQTTEETVAKPEVRYCLEQLTKEINELSEGVSVLIKRIEPVSKPTPESPLDCGKGLPAPQYTEIGGLILEQTDRIKGMASRVMTAINALEV